MNLKIKKESKTVNCYFIVLRFHICQQSPYLLTFFLMLLVLLCLKINEKGFMKKYLVGNKDILVEQWVLKRTYALID